ncbi:MAG: LysR family transcriptional regulator [Ferrovum myxofaciens]
MKLTLESVQIIDAIDRAGSMAGAAEILHRVPSTISYSIAKLENQLDIRLFDRNGPRISLTSAGVELLREGRWLLRAFADLECRLHKISSGYESEIRIVFDSFIPSEIFIDDLREFGALECGTRIRMTSEVMTGVWESLHEGRADIIIASGDRPGWSGYLVQKIDSVEFAFCVSPGHPLASETKPIRFDDLYSHTAIVVADSARSLPSRTVGVISGQQRITVPDMKTKIQFQKVGLGFGFLPRILIEVDLETGLLVELPTEEPRPPDPIWIAKRTADDGEAARWWYKKLSRQLITGAGGR